MFLFNIFNNETVQLDRRTGSSWHYGNMSATGLKFNKDFYI